MATREARVRAALSDAGPPDGGQAEERAWLVVREAFAEREPAAPRRPPWARLAAGLTCAAAAAALALTPAGASVRQWIEDAIGGEENARPVLGALPSEGAVLAESRGGAWIVRDDASRRRLGEYRHVTWSPHGLYVAGASGRELVAMTQLGEVRWSVTAPAPIESLAWSSDEGWRVAYVAGTELRVVAGDGTSDAALARRVGSPAIAWRPEADPAAAHHELAYVDAGGRLVLRDTDSGRTISRTSAIRAQIRSLQWSADGGVLMVAADGFALVFDESGSPLFKGPLAVGATHATLSPDGRNVAAVHTTAAGAELVLTPARAAGGRERTLYVREGETGPVRFGAPLFSPDGEWVLLPWRQVDQWLFIRVADRRVVAVGDVSRQLDADRRGEAAFPAPTEWCCTPDR